MYISFYYFYAYSRLKVMLSFRLKFFKYDKNAAQRRDCKLADCPCILLICFFQYSHRRIRIKGKRWSDVISRGVWGRITEARNKNTFLTLAKIENAFFNLEKRL